MFHTLVLICLFCVENMAGTAGIDLPNHTREAGLAQSSTCRDCHEERYTLFDSGKWVCLCGKQGTCTDCHEGQEETWEIQLAHEGMIANPITENPSICLSCHPQNGQERILKFAATTGLDLNAPPPPPTFYESGPLSERPTILPALLKDQPMQSWRKQGLVLNGLFWIVLVIFGVHCWKADCIKKHLPQEKNS